MEGFPLLEWVLNTYDSSWEIKFIFASMGIDTELTLRVFAVLPCHIH